MHSTGLLPYEEKIPEVSTIYTDYGLVGLRSLDLVGSFFRSFTLTVKIKVKSENKPSGPSPGPYIEFRSMKQLGVLLLLLSGFPDSSLVPIYTPGWSGAL